VQEVTRAGTGSPAMTFVEGAAGRGQPRRPAQRLRCGRRPGRPTRQRASSPGLRRRWLVATALLTVGADVVAIGLGYVLAKVFRDGDLDIVRL